MASLTICKGGSSRNGQWIQVGRYSAFGYIARDTVSGMNVANSLVERDDAERRKATNRLEPRKVPLLGPLVWTAYGRKGHTARAAFGQVSSSAVHSA